MMNVYMRRPYRTHLLRPHRLGEYRFEGGRYLPVDVHVDEDAYIVSASVPGLDPKELKVEILDDILTLKGEIFSDGNGDGEYLLRERGYGKFERRLRLPEVLDAKGAEAKVEHGILTIRIPKAEEAKPRMIEVKTK